MLIISHDYSPLEKIYEDTDSVRIFTYTNQYEPEEKNGMEINKKINNILLEYSTEENYTKIKLMKMTLTGLDGNSYTVNKEAEDLVSSVDMNPYSEKKGLNRWSYTKGSFPYLYQNYFVKAILLICKHDNCIKKEVTGDLKAITRKTRKNTWLRSYG